MKLVAGMGIFVLAGVALAQNDSQLTPRQIFDYGMKAPAVKTNPTPKNAPSSKPKPIETPPVKAPGAPVEMPPVDAAANRKPKTSEGAAQIEPVAYTPLAVRYSILQKKGNSFEEVDADTEFHSGDRIRVRVEANGTGYLYIVMGGSSGQWQVLFPSKDIAGGNNFIDRGEPCTIPSGGDSFLFDSTAGVEKVSLVLSRTPQPDLEKLIYAAGDPTRTGDKPKFIMASNHQIDDAVLGGVREKLLSRDLVFEKSEPSGNGKSQDKAVYVASPKSTDAPLFVDLKLTHK